MNNDDRKLTGWRVIFPRSRGGIFLIVIIAVVAFVLGGLLLNGGNAEKSAFDAGRGDAETGSADEPTMWTCSMHPQIQLPKPGKCPICFMDLIPVTTGGGAELESNQIRISETAMKLAGIQTSPVTRAYAERSIRLVGKLDYDETRVSYITAWVPGRLDRLFVDYTGIRVAMGDHMVEMYSPELIAAQEELLQAKRAVSALTEANSTVLMSTATETLRSAREKLRLYGLSEEQIAAIEQGDSPTERLTITAPTSGIVLHKDALEGMYVATGTQIYTIADLSKLWLLLEAYESDLSWLRYGQHFNFTSPSFPGETFDAIISFIDPVVDPMTRTVRIRGIVDNQNGRLKPEMFVSGTVLSRLDSGGRVMAPEFAGKWISPMHPEIVKDIPGQCDICGMDLVPAESLGFSTRSQKIDRAPLLIPASAPLLTGKRAVVYVKMQGDDGVVFEGREVTLGPRAQDYYVVKEGLSEGEEVVTNGAFKIDSELQIQAKQSMMSPQGGTSAPAHQHGSTAQVARSETAEASVYRAGTAKRLLLTDEAQLALIPIYSAYFKVQMALANDDLDATKGAYDALAQAVSEANMSLFKDEAHTRWLTISQGLVSSVQSGSSAKDIVEARDAFYHASQSMIELHDTFGHTGDNSFYLTFCPMARDNKGAYWLQQANIVWNSFYGAAMLRCGEIKQELKAETGMTE
jgi:Cu(I)/Ag(I) efflux system membrane fusion protein